MNIGIDLDGVLYPWHDIVYQRECLDHGWNLTNSEFWSRIHSLYSGLSEENLVKTRHYYGVANIDQRNLDLLNKLDKDNQLFYITSRDKELEFVTNNWMKRNNIPQRENLIFTKDKKIHVLLNNISIFIEDNIKNALELNPYCKVVIVRSEYNKNIPHNFEIIPGFYALENLL